MTATYVLDSQQSSALAGAREERHSVPAGTAQSLCVARPQLLRVAQGCAWVTFDEGPYGLGRDEAAGDWFVQAGEMLWLAAGCHAVVESVGPVPLQYRLSHAERPQVLHRWWQRTQMGPHGASACYA